MFTYRHQPKPPTLLDAASWFPGPVLAALMHELSAADVLAMFFAFGWSHTFWTLALILLFPLDRAAWEAATADERGRLMLRTGTYILGALAVAYLPLIFFQVNCITNWIPLGGTP